MPQYQSILPDKATLVNKIDGLNELCLSPTANKDQYECLNKQVSKRKTHLAKIERSSKPDIYIIGT